MKGHTESVYAIAIAPDGLRAISAAGYHTLRVWDLLTGAWLGTLKGHSGSLAGVSMAESGAAPESGAARAPIVVVARIGSETAMRPAAKSPHVVLDINPPFPAERLAASTSPVPVVS